MNVTNSAKALAKSKKTQRGLSSLSFACCIFVISVVFTSYVDKLSLKSNWNLETILCFCREIASLDFVTFSIIWNNRNRTVIVHFMLISSFKYWSDHCRFKNFWEVTWCSAYRWCRDSPHIIMKQMNQLMGILNGILSYLMIPRLQEGIIM